MTNVITYLLISFNIDMQQFIFFFFFFFKQKTAYEITRGQAAKLVVERFKALRISSVPYPPTASHFRLAKAQGGSSGSTIHQLWPRGKRRSVHCSCPTLARNSSIFCPRLRKRSSVVLWRELTAAKISLNFFSLSSSRIRTCAISSSRRTIRSFARPTRVRHIT